MKSIALSFGLISGGLGLSVLLASCSPRSCEDAESEYYSRLEECNVDFIVDGSEEHVCDDFQRQLTECELSCANAVSCEALRGEGGDERKTADACFDYCQAFIFQVIPREDTGQ